MKHTNSTSSSTLVRCTCILVLVVLLCSSARGASITKRAVAEGSRTNGDSEPMKTCHVSTPCGWAVYTPFTRRVDYFLRNTCRCPENKKCIRTDDDLSVSAYVYRCRDGASSTPSPDRERS